MVRQYPLLLARVAYDRSPPAPKECPRRARKAEPLVIQRQRELKTFHLDEIVEAHRCMEENKVDGKIVVLI